jgi:hypothetical protein
MTLRKTDKFGKAHLYSKRMFGTGGKNSTDPDGSQYIPV